MEREANLDIDPGLLPLQADAAAALLTTPIVVRTVGTLASIAGLLGPDILIAVAANTVSYTTGGSTLTFSLAPTASTSIFNATTEFQKSGTKVVGARQTGWGAASGTLSRAAYASYAGQTVSNPPTQAEMQALDDAVKLLSQTVAALITDLRTHGLIGT